MSWTTPQDIKDRWRGSGTPTDDNKLQTDIDDVEGQIKFAYPQIQERIDDEELPLNIIVSFVSNVVIQYWKTLGNPYQNVSEGTGPFSKSVSYIQGARYDLRLSNSDLTLLAPTTSGIVDIDMANDMVTRQRSVWKTIRILQ